MKDDKDKEKSKDKLKKKHKKNDYFRMLEDMVGYCSEASQLLETIISEYNTDSISEMSVAMHKIEHSADIAHHEITRRLSQEFITPIEREDIAALVNVIDNVVDSLEDIVLRFYIFNVSELRREALEFADILIKQNAALGRLLAEFKDFRKSKTIHEHIVAINHLEEEGDRIYYAAIRRLYSEDNSPVEILKWTEIFRRMEGCCDYIEDVAQLVENVIMKNS